MTKNEIRVLAIEDNQDDADLISALLSKEKEPPFLLFHARRLAEALAYLARHYVHVVLLDLGLPDSLGISAVQDIKKIAPHVPIIVLTGLNDEETAKKALQAEVQDYLHKGEIDRNLLVRSIRYAIERKRTIEALRMSEARFRQLSESGILGIAYYDADGRITDANESFLSMVGYERRDVETGAVRWGQLTPPAWIERTRQADEEFRASGRITPYEKEFFRRDGKTFWGLFGCARVDGLAQAISFIVDITARKKLEEEITHLAHHDVLTGLPNRRLLRDFFRVELLKARREQTKLALLFMDLDRFKEINDTLGHEAGDEMLKAVAGRLKSCARESDIVARIGGDEFNILLSDVARPDDITGFAQKVIASMGEPFQIAGREIDITTSIGISMFPDDSVEVEELFRFADIALYNAKEGGRNTFRFYDHGLNQGSVEKLEFESWLRRALAHGELTLHYQPQVNVKTRGIKSAEALVRWNHPTLGRLDSKRFIPIAESIGYIAAIDEWVLRTAGAQFKTWLDAGFAPPCVTVNISSRIFRNTAFADAIAASLDNDGLTTDCLELEIKEDLAMGDLERNITLLKNLAAKGIGISIDDFGAGYSSLHNLKRLPVTKLKLDQSIVKDIATDPDSRTLISAMIAMAHKMNMLVVAKGVETEEQLSFLREAECDEAQGYLFSGPVPPEQFSELMVVAK